MEYRGLEGPHGRSWNTGGKRDLIEGSGIQGARGTSWKELKYR
jgi:hypothetical protein